MEFLIIPYMALMSVWSGGSLWPSQYLKGFWTNVPEIFFALGFGYALYPIIGFYALIPIIWSYIWMQTGHANALPWGQGGHNPDRENTLSPIIKWISDKVGIEYYSTNYARLFMAVKGFLITLPVGGFLGAILWPLGYEIGNRLKNHAASESLSGAGAGVCIWVFLLWI